MFQKDRWKLEELRRNVYDLQKTVENFLEKNNIKSVPFCRIRFLGTQITFQLAFSLCFLFPSCTK